MCDRVDADLAEAGVVAEAYHAGLADRERSRVQEAFAAGSIRGSDIRAVSAVVPRRATGFRQQATGRTLKAVRSTGPLPVA